MEVSRRDLIVKKMAQYLRAGATLTSYTCPACSTPLLKLKSGEHYCVNCEKPVIIVKTDEEEAVVSMRYGLTSVRDTIFTKILMINKELRAANDVEHIQDLTKSLILLLEAYDKISRIINELGKTESSK